MFLQKKQTSLCRLMILIDMEYNIISTGSKGNAVVINDVILIDCGVSFRALKDVYKNIKIVLLTHIHSDHFNRRTIKALANNRPTLRFTAGVHLLNDLVECGVDKSNIDVVEAGKTYNYGLFQISPIKLYHDVPNFGYRIFMNNERLIYATDTNSMKGIKAENYDFYMIEANYIDEEIQERIREKERQGQYAYERGVLHTHLSKQKCDNFIYENIGRNGSYVYLHQHEDRNNGNTGCNQGL